MTQTAAPSTLFDLSGRVACVTGATSGLGRQAASVLVRAGAAVVGVARREAALEDWRTEAGGQTATVTCDVGNRENLEALARDVSAPFGAPDIVIHAAGINTREPADEVTPEGWDTTLSLNLSTPFFLSQALAPAMSEKGWGRIVTFASLQTWRAFPGGVSYGASKGGIAQLTRAMAEAWSSRGINANAIGPGFFRTELTAPVFDNPELSRKLADQTCIGRNGDLSDIDGPLLFLCSEASAYVTGQVLMVDGGFTAK
ncbi:MAG: SDR family oxidoreductase [Dinoroseobacter sp.]|nr:SDR family oxidoreductase [Dinoroseobacter sp.]